MVAILKALYVVFAAIFAVVFGKDVAKANKEGKLEEQSTPKVAVTGFITDFFDTLGIGSFAPTIAMSKALKLNIPDKKMPGTLNVAHTIPVVTEAFIFTSIIPVDGVTLVSMVVAAAVGSYIGAGIIAKMDERKIQLVMGVTLALTAILMLLGHPWINLLPGGGNELGLTGVKLVIGVIGNFILGALMTAGIGLYAPGMAMVYFLGMSAKVAFPIVMGSCALLMPVASMKFIKEDAYTKKASVIIAICGLIGVFVAAYIVKTLPMDILKALVIVVIAYTSATMIMAANKNKKTA
ncbi:TPA: TSUP family transporter [Clostridioides difficile]|nr:TSUP family transporter [Clostridioides difficile]